MCFRVRGLGHILSTPSWALKRRTVLKIKNSGMQWLLEFWEGRGVSSVLEEHFYKYFCIVDKKKV